MEELNEKKTKYFVIAIIILIILGVLLIVHFNNKEVVKGEEKNSDTTTTEKITTTTKKRINVEANKSVPDVYKSVIDEDNKLVYNYKLTDEILDTDKLISKKVELTEVLIKNNIIGLFDISLYDSNLVKKSVSNSLITIKIPLTDELKGYEEYNVVYINDKNEITDEKFEVKVDSDYIEFNTTHLSLFGIVGINKVVEEKVVVDLTKVTVDVKVNDEVVENVNNILLEKKDKLELVVSNIDESCKVEYGLRPTGNNVEFTALEYKKYEGNLELKDGVNYTLVVKVSNEESNKIFELGKIGLYDEVFKYDKNEVIENDKIVGKIENEDGSESDYKDIQTNKDIVIDYKESEAIEDNSTNTGTSNEGTTLQSSQTNGEAAITVNGNIYLVEKTDISKLQMTGHLFIDTSEEIIFAENEEKLDLSDLYSITIRSKEFMLNGKKYSYEYTPDENLIIYLIEEKVSTEEEMTDLVSQESENTTNKTVVYDSKEESNSFNEIFNVEENEKVVVYEKETELIIEKIKTQEPNDDENTNEGSEPEGSGATQSTQEPQPLTE